MSIGIEIFISNIAYFNVKGYSDSDRESRVDSRRSISNFVVFVGDVLISWK